MGKKKKKSQQQQPAFSARKPKDDALNKRINSLRPIALVKDPLTNQVFQKPEALGIVPELTDDTSPNLKALDWQPVAGASSKTAKQVPKLTKLHDNWVKFQESLKHKEGSAFQNTFVETKAPEEMKKSSSAKSSSAKSSSAKSSSAKSSSAKSSSEQSKEITWELNPIDDKVVKETKKFSGKAAPGKPEVVQGKASEIKLFLQNKEKPVAVQTPTSGTIISDRTFSSNSSQHSSNGSKCAFPKGHSSISSGINIDNRPLLAYPSGVPKSFLVNQTNTNSIQPQDNELAKNSTPATSWLTHPLLTQQSQREKPSLYVQNPTQDKHENQEEKQQYSPTEVYDNMQDVEEHEGSESPDGQSSLKRLSAFQRLGPLSQPKKPKLTINLMCSKDESVREVVDQNNSIEEDEKFTSVHLRKDMRDSNDELVVKYLPYWPWRRNLLVRKIVTARSSKSVMILEQEQMEEAYEKENIFIAVMVRGYPTSWRKEQILDAILDNVKGKSFIPCFIEFKPDYCRFLVIKCRAALIAIHKLGFYIRKDDIELRISIGLADLNLKQLDFIPRLILRKFLAAGYDGERKLSLKEFTIGNEISHFIYFPLNRLTNQAELVQIQSTIAWNYITDLDLSYNRITSIDGFELPHTTPRLKHLDLSYNSLQKVAALLPNRELSLRSLKLEGNPLCHDYIDPGHYVKVVKMIFPGLVELDGIPIHLKGDFPPTKKNYCPNTEAMNVANKFLDVFFPLLEMPVEERARIEALYHRNALMTVTYRYTLRYSALHKKFRNIFLRARVLADGDEESIAGAPDIARILCKWPEVRHDPATFTVDVLLHTENHTILKIGGILKLTAETLADDEHLVAFTRNVVLSTDDGVEYKITNEMVYWDEPSKEMTDVAFRLNTVRSLELPIKLDVVNPDAELKEHLVEIFTHITNLEKLASERCLEIKEWNLKSALEHFMKLVKLDDLDSLRVDSPVPRN